MSLLGLLLMGCQVASSDPGPAKASVPDQPAQRPAPELSNLQPVNVSAYIPPQCYANTIDERGGVHNPCFVCHHDGWRPNFIGDGSVQTAYDLPDPALNNPWTNLRVDRRAELAAIDEPELLAYVRRSNYREGDQLLLAARLSELPPGWDQDDDGSWSGYVPDAWFEFDARGFDHGPDGALTGWRAYAFRPLPGAFFPTNGGSIGDALIRLPKAFRRDAAGVDSLAVYELNLAILEALITRADVAIEPSIERDLGVDLDGDGSLGIATIVHFQWAPLRGQTMRWVGEAGLAQERGELELAAGLFPVGTEFLHSVRYLDVAGPERRVVMAPRMKELRYARKRRWLSYSELDAAAAEDAKQRIDFPARVRDVFADLERGASTGIGWVMQGFIEDAGGELRPQTVEETMFCVGCHSGVGATDDGIYSFGRKLGPDAPARGWTHTATDNGHRVGDHTRADDLGEYATYLIENEAGDDFRANQELLARFFDEHGEPRMQAINALAEDVSPLLLPSPERALALDAAYRLVVREQSYALGRDSVLAPTMNLHMALAPAQPTGIEVPVHGPRDRRPRPVR
ncbi:hypothetical protein [Enhygromyxa salina]|uniref:hypothetical protein n=1 Tax=Enhygromyxa salina TaxID=215803 RepID=UPI000D03110D|nr:hypothetical protein [Enhygromyxa salina]